MISAGRMSTGKDSQKNFWLTGLLLISLWLPFVSVNGAVSRQTQPPSSPLEGAARLARQALNRVVEAHFFPDFAPTPVPKGTGQKLAPQRWQEWPAIPVVSQRAVQIYKLGLEAGNNARHFSKVGDCQNIRQYFLGIFDEPGSYFLGKNYDNLERAIYQFTGSWSRVSEAVRTGFNVASVLTPINANPKNCKPAETPLECEIRIWKPALVLISMETWTKDRPTLAYETYLRQIVEYAITQNVLPVVATKADNLEGDHSINLAVARVAADYDIPLWNFWRVTQPLPGHGLEGDGFHLTNASNFFDNPDFMEHAWPWRNLTGLQVIDFVWRTTLK